MINIDDFQGSTRGERQQNALIHLLGQINDKLDLLIPNKEIIEETIVPVDLPVKVEEVKKKIRKKAQVGVW